MGTKKTAQHIAAGIYVGASPAAVEASHVAILDILNARVDNKTMRAALNALSSVCAVNGASLSNCVVDQRSDRG